MWFLVLLGVLLLAYGIHKLYKDTKATMALDAKWASAKHETIFHFDPKHRLSQKQNITFANHPMETYWWDEEDSCWTDKEGKKIHYYHNDRAYRAINNYVRECSSKSTENLRKKAQW